MHQVFQLDPNTSNVDVVIHDQSTVLDYSVERLGALRTGVPVGSLEDSAKLPDPHLLAAEIADDLRTSLEA